MINLLSIPNLSASAIGWPELHECNSGEKSGTRCGPIEFGSKKMPPNPDKLIGIQNLYAIAKRN